jgi:aryl-alcohol dehydrogenase-like predicted oxidoreductase
VNSETYSPTRLILGTAQFGLNYGIANQSGQTSASETKSILQCAQAHGVRVIDTAAAYGDCEQRLGEIGLNGWGVVSKIPLCPDDVGDIGGWVQESVKAILSRLKMPSLYGLLLHSPQQLLGSSGPALYAALHQLKIGNLAQKIGVSIYDPAELDALCSRYEFDIVQCPFNVMDRRLIDSGWLYRLRDQGTELHARSIFLQGLLLMSRETRPVKFSRWSDLWAAWQRWLERASITPLHACLNYALSFPEIGHVVLGVDNVSQLREILAVMGRATPEMPRDLQCKDVQLIDPSCWSFLR